MTGLISFWRRQRLHGFCQLLPHISSHLLFSPLFSSPTSALHSQPTHTAVSVVKTYTTPTSTHPRGSSCNQLPCAEDRTAAARTKLPRCFALSLARSFTPPSGSALGNNNHYLIWRPAMGSTAKLCPHDALDCCCSDACV